MKKEKTMADLKREAEDILSERFGRDSVISLATAEENMPHVRSVNAFYEDGAFYILTYALSGKMKQLEKNPAAALCGEWFTAHGIAENLGYIGKAENEAIAKRMKTLFAGWLNNGHVDLEDEHTCILKIRLTDGVLFSHGTRYELKFEE